MANRRYKTVEHHLTAPAANVRLSRNRPLMASAAQPAPDYRALLESSISWSATGDLDTPWRAVLSGQTLTVRMNDFPDEALYTLIVDGKAAHDFDDWPARWMRG